MLNWIAPYNVMLLHVDLTNDFMPGGALAVTGGDEIVPVANALRNHFQQVGWTKEEHDPHHKSFASSNPGKKPLDVVQTPFGPQYLWPDHCVTGTTGADFHPGLIVKQEDLVVVKGTDPDIHAYSAVKLDDRQTTITYPDDGKSLVEKLRDRQIDTVVIDGLAFDFCVGWTALDLAEAGFKIILLRDATRSITIPLDEGRTTESAMEEQLIAAGVTITTVDELKTFPLQPQQRLSA